MKKEEKQMAKPKKQERPISRPSASRQLQPFNDRLWMLLVFLFAFVLYANTIPHGYVLDDYGVIKDNFVVKRGFDGIPLILKTPYRYGISLFSDDLYRPLSLVMFAVEWELAPDTPALGHFMNVLFYAFTCVLLLILLRRLFAGRNPLFPLFITLLWAAHPIHTEAVANIKSRDEILSVFFLLLSLLGFLRFLEKKNIPAIAGALVCYFLAFLSKEGIITFLVLFPLTGWYFAKAPVRRQIAASALMVIPAIAYLLIRYSVLSRFPSPTVLSISDNLLVAAPDLVSRYATAVMILGKYLLLLVVPYRLVSDYSFNQIPIVGAGDPAFIVSFLVYAAALVYAAVRISKKEVVVYGILFYLVTMSIYSNLFTLIGTSFGERLLFLPSIGFSILAGWGLLRIFGLRQDTGSDFSLKGLFTRYPFPWVILLVILAGYSAKTITRNAEWKDQKTLFGADVKRSPNSSHMRYYWGVTIRDEAKEQTDPALYNSMMKEAIEEFKKALEINPGYAECYEQLGLAYFRTGENDKAIQSYEMALKYNPTKAVTWANQGIIYFQKGETLKALELYKKSVELDPNYDDGYFNLGSTYGALGEYRLAIYNFKKCLEFKPENAMAWYYTGITYETLKMADSARFFLEKAYSLNPSLKK